MRIGNGFDIHRLVAGRPLILGGVTIPHGLGLLGHSDGDALSHAIIDALLGAAGLGDIGVWFPPGDPRYKDADSLELLKQVKESLSEHKYRIENIDATIICERPKLSGYFASMKDSLSRALNLRPEQVSVKATTMEGLGEIGAGQAIAVQSIALLSSL